MRVMGGWVERDCLVAQMEAVVSNGVAQCGQGERLISMVCEGTWAGTGKSV